MGTEFGSCPSRRSHEKNSRGRFAVSKHPPTYLVKKHPSADYNFLGQLSMYLKSGFTTHRDANWYLVVKKTTRTQSQPYRVPVSSLFHPWNFVRTTEQLFYKIGIN